MESRIPKAWLPAYTFELESERKYQDLLADLCEIGEPFVFKCWDWDGFEYQHSVDAYIKPSTGQHDSAVIELRVTKKYQSRANIEALLSRNFKRSLPTSPLWTRMMPGKPAAKIVANHTLAGIKFAAEFKPNMGFEVKSETNQGQALLDAVLRKHRVWSMPSTGNLWFLNT
jgi:hypothetical protein